MHHSSFLRGGKVAGAGEISTTEEGVVTEVSARSGHHLPGDDQDQQVLKRLQEAGVNLDNVRFDSRRPG